MLPLQSKIAQSFDLLTMKISLFHTTLLTIIQIMKLVACLVEAGASINLGNASGNSPLHLACYESHKEIAILLLKKGASEDNVNKAGKRPVEMASGELKKELIEA